MAIKLGSQKGRLGFPALVWAWPLLVMLVLASYGPVGAQTMYDQDVKDVLHSLMQAEDDYFTENSQYTSDLGALQNYGYMPNSDVTVTFVKANREGYVATGTHRGGGQTWTFDSFHGGIQGD